MNGQELKQLREASGMTRTELGLKMGFSEDKKKANKRIYEYESGARKIVRSNETLFRLLLGNQTNVL